MFCTFIINSVNTRRAVTVAHLRSRGDRSLELNMFNTGDRWEETSPRPSPRVFTTDDRSLRRSPRPITAKFGVVEGGDIKIHKHNDHDRHNR